MRFNSPECCCCCCPSFFKEVSKIIRWDFLVSFDLVFNPQRFKEPQWFIVQMILTVQIFLKILSLSYLWALNKCLMGVLLIPCQLVPGILLMVSQRAILRKCFSGHLNWGKRESVSLDIQRGHVCIPTPIHSTTFIECLLCAQFEYWYLIQKYRIWCTFEDYAVNIWSLKSCWYRKQLPFTFLKFI